MQTGFCTRLKITPTRHGWFNSTNFRRVHEELEKTQRQEGRYAGNVYLSKMRDGASSKIGMLNFRLNNRMVFLKVYQIKGLLKGLRV